MSEEIIYGSLTNVCAGDRIILDNCAYIVIGTIIAKNEDSLWPEKGLLMYCRDFEGKTSAAKMTESRLKEMRVRRSAQVFGLYDKPKSNLKLLNQAQKDFRDASFISRKDNWWMSLGFIERALSDMQNLKSAIEIRQIFLQK